MPSKYDIALGGVLLLALVLASWKVMHRPGSAEFVAPAPQITANSAPSTSAGVAHGTELSPDGQFRFDADFVSAAPGQAVHAATMVELTNGDVRAVWFSGSREGAGDVTIQTAVLNATTGQWRAESTLFNRAQVQRSLMRYVKKIGNPVIARAPDGALVLWMVNVSLGGWAGSAISSSRSVDEGQTWSSPQRLVTSPFLNISTLVKGAPVSMTDGRMALPVYHEFFTKLAEVLQLDAAGQVVDKVRVAGRQRSLQPVMLVSGPQTAQMYMRSGTAAGLITSATQDAGQTWSVAHTDTWPNPDAAVAGVVALDHTQWLALNPTTNHREQLALIHAPLGGHFDGAQPWMVEATRSPGKRLSVSEYERLLGSELRHRGASADDALAYVASARRQLCGATACAQEFSYPFLLTTRDGALHLVYTWHRTRIKHIRFDPLQHHAAKATP